MSDLTKLVLLENEYRVYVDYDMLQDKARFESEISDESVSELLYDYEWKLEPSCAEIDQSPGEREMLLKRLDHDTKRCAVNITEMDELGYRPAIHLEAYAFAKANPELLDQFRIFAFGSSAMGHGNRQFGVLLNRGCDGRIVCDAPFFKYKRDSDNRLLAVIEWAYNGRVLFVRK